MLTGDFINHNPLRILLLPILRSSPRGPDSDCGDDDEERYVIRQKWVHNERCARELYRTETHIKTKGSVDAIEYPPGKQSWENSCERAPSSRRFRQIAEAGGGGHENCKARFGPDCDARRMPWIDCFVWHGCVWIGGHLLSCSSSSRSVGGSGVSGTDSSRIGSLMTYFSLDQFPRSRRRQRSLQNGKSALVSESVALRQMGQRHFMTNRIPRFQRELRIGK